LTATCPGGRALIARREEWIEEVQRSDKALQVLGGKFHQLIPITLPGVAEDRFLVVVDKIANTPSAYPRKPGIPAKKPLV
jgi:16S rRNA (guanine527-N7)-methyltransferase